MENKWVGFSRSLWSMLLPVILVMLRVFGVDDTAMIGDIATKVIDSSIVVASLVLQFLHQKNPEPTNVSN